MDPKPKLACDGLIPESAAKMLEFFDRQKALFSQNIYDLCSSYVNAERQSYVLLFKYRILRKN